MSNSVTTAIRESVRDMAIGKTKTTEKADRATVEQVNKISGSFSSLKCFFLCPNVVFNTISLQVVMYSFLIVWCVC